MSTLGPEEIQARIAPYMAAAGIVPVSMEVVPYDEPPLDAEPVANVYVSLEGTAPDVVHAAMMKAERIMSTALGADVRGGYYSREVGYDDIPEGQAMLQFDGLPFSLVSARPSRPGR